MYTHKYMYILTQNGILTGKKWYIFLVFFIKEFRYNYYLLINIKLCLKKGNVHFLDTISNFIVWKSY